MIKKEKMKKKNNRSKTTKISPVHHAKKIVRITPKFIHGMVIGMVVGVLVVGSLRYATSVYAAPGNNDSYCLVDPVSVDGGHGPFNSFTVSGNIATTTFDVKGLSGCIATLSMASWQAPYGSTDFTPFKDQKLLYTKTADFTSGRHTFSIQIDETCYYQVDMVRGTTPTASDGTADYRTGQVQVLDFVQGGSKACEPPVTPPATTTPSTPATPAAAATTPAPTKLVNTGPGAIVIIGLLAVIGGYIFHIRHKRRHARHY